MADKKRGPLVSINGTGTPRIVCSGVTQNLIAGIMRDSSF